MPRPTVLPPLSLYVHFPWCARKCPYCDFNSHSQPGVLPEPAYLDALLRDLELELPRVWGRRVQTIFIGGGTPSLMTASAVDQLLSGIRARLPLSPDAEITLEANPGTTDSGHFAGYLSAGVNRLSIGVQSFDDRMLSAIGRIHNGAQARVAVDQARAAGFNNVNIDLMFGLPGQTVPMAVSDLRQALQLEPTHVSAYQLTLEPNTPFYAQPPKLPVDDDIAVMEEAIQDRLATAGYDHYEVSAYAKPGRECRHNRNYWEFGDYIGIGAGAHGKITDPAAVTRRARRRQPQDYMRHAGTEAALADVRIIDDSELAFEFMLNALRLIEGIPIDLLPARTGIPLADVQPIVDRAVADGLLETSCARLGPTRLGRRFLNDLTARFLPSPLSRQHG